MVRFNRYYHVPCMPLGKDGRCITGCREHINLSRKAAGEGMVLLKNNEGVLPLKKGSKVVAFGQAAINYVKGGTGSGDVYCAYVKNIYDGLEDKENEGKLTYFKPLKELYTNHLAVEENKKIECIIPDDMFNDAVKFSDTAIISIGRNSGEFNDRTAERGDYYLTESEEALVNRVTSSFKKVVVVLNVGGMVDTNWFYDNDKISSVLLGWQGGMEGALATVDILTGDVNPSGKLTDTFAKSFDDYPSSATFNESVDYVNYIEDIYVGYRYFETIPDAYKKVNYPFGFGLSYTTFAYTDIVAKENDGQIDIKLNITNTGKMSGKEVVQVYYSAPQGKLGKPSKELVTFTKTKLLNPGETEELNLSFAVKDMASFDDLGKIQKSAYVLEKGDYKIYVASSVRDTVDTGFVYSVSEDIVAEQLTSYCAPVALEKRMLSDGSFEELPKGEIKNSYPVNKEIKVDAPEERLWFHDVYTEEQLDKFIMQFTVENLFEFMGGYSCTGVSNTGCFPRCYPLAVPPIPTADGPAGLRLEEKIGIATTAFPCATLLACSWNTEIMEQIGATAALEVKENNIAFWLTPALNIHRSPLCGRNFEYFSEDPVVSGEMAAAKVKGIQSVKIGCTIKHLACNNKEENRFCSDSRVSERALREIYLKGFEISVKKANPWGLMTSYNAINGVHTSESYELLGGILRGEWGFNGLITTDWGVKNNPVNEVKAGNDIKMHCGYPNELKEAYEKGELTLADLQVCAKHILAAYMNLE